MMAENNGQMRWSLHPTYSGPHVTLRDIADLFGAHPGRMFGINPMVIDRLFELTFTADTWDFQMFHPP